MPVTEADRRLPAGPADLPVRRHPPFLGAVMADVMITSGHRGDPLEDPSMTRTLLEAIRLCWVTESFFAQVSYRLEARLRDIGVPVLPRLLHKLAIWVGGLQIGEEVVVAPGLNLAHGQVVIDGVTDIGPGVSIFPFVMIGPAQGERRGPTVEAHSYIGTGAKLVGPIVVGVSARVGANAVVLDDVPEDGTAVGIAEIGPAGSSGEVR